ncbi:uncharacterized protein EV154DRAFT_516371 [Mucor mucedo]|uniref:Transcription initiation factor IIF subunit alpha n=1 Tax=Mucor saturninus TaxID=64648 RepID=A0A8H7QWC5_9FUNG|nr:uncharacterized protein EV154DRAFT_516371 [Mucor mucedo]KAG2199946.1 hypothetical protein INT47_009272 [Mucor saturninus]KAI7888842.1 hypothetical protein EV154DRAFT_516371 [Mucor mucedo]
MSIYNTSRTDKSKTRAPLRRGGGPLRPGMGQHRLMQQQLQQQQLQQPEEPLTFNEFQLMSTSKRGQNHLMDFKSNKRVEVNKFARPVKLHRKETNFIPYRQYIQNLNEQNAANAAANAVAAAKAAAIMAGTPIPNDTSNRNNKNVEDLGNEISPDGPQVTPQPQHGPKTGADTSLIAPLGGATRNKQMLFKKRTKQIYLAKEDTRELKEQEHRPWILEDYDSHNSFTGTLEGGQRSDYMFFVLSDNGFKVMPVDRWYKFQAKRNFKTLSLEEAEEQLKKQQKRENGRWMMLKRENEQAEAMSDAVRPNKLKLVDHDDAAKAGSDDEGKNRQDSDMDDLDFDDVFQDDDEATAEHEVEDEDIKDSKDRVKKEIKDYAISGKQEPEDNQYDEMGKLTSEGKQMRKLVRDLEKNRAYESDEEGDPYASSAEELDSDAEDEDGDDEEKDKKASLLNKKKGVAPPAKPVMPKKAHTAKVKKEGMSKPIGRPGSPSLYNKREGSPTTASNGAGRSASPAGSSSSPLRPSSPLNPSSPSRHASTSHRSPTPSSPNKEHGKKRRLEDTSVINSLDVKHRKTGRDDNLITEQEVIDTLRGRPMTTKEFLMNFRKRMKSNDQNRTIITELLRKVAKRNNSADPHTRLLELKPEFQ